MIILMHRFVPIAFVFLIFHSNVTTGMNAGSWRDHFSYRRATHVAVSEHAVYCAAASGLIVFRKKDNSIEKFSKVNGLSDVDISSIKWSEENNLLIAGYSNGNLDIINQKKVINLSDILRSPVAGSKSINNILFIGNKAYLSCNFGIVVVDLVRNEISETYYLGYGGERLNVNDMAFDGSNIYASTSSGIYAADINAPNLMDFSYWNRLDLLPDPGALFLSVAWYDEKLYAVQMTSSGSYVTMTIENGSWRYFTEPSNNPVRLNSYRNHLTVIKESETEIYSQGHGLTEKISDYGLWGIAMRDVQVDERHCLDSRPSAWPDAQVRRFI
jgi:hypothetical protein